MTSVPGTEVAGKRPGVMFREDAAVGGAQRADNAEVGRLKLRSQPR